MPGKETNKKKKHQIVAYVYTIYDVTSVFSGGKHKYENLIVILRIVLFVSGALAHRVCCNSDE